MTRRKTTHMGTVEVDSLVRIGVGCHVKERVDGEDMWMHSSERKEGEGGRNAE
jgi:hypothetical protein